MASVQQRTAMLQTFFYRKWVSFDPSCGVSDRQCIRSAPAAWWWRGYDRITVQLVEYLRMSSIKPPPAQKK
jgi:hypothetical protein